jgi:superfamily II DNA or RNA helicase
VLPPGLEQERPPIQQVYAALAADEARNAMIFNDVLQALEDRCSPVILTERKDHALLLAKRVSRFARNVIVLTGGIGAKQRRSAMQRLGDVSATDERVLIATGRYIGEGFDDARLDMLFLAMPISWKGTIAQYVGRLHRLYPAKREVIVYDYVDECVPVLKRMSEKRVRGYKSLGYSIDAHSSSSGASA